MENYSLIFEYELLLLLISIGKEIVFLGEEVEV